MAPKKQQIRKGAPAEKRGRQDIAPEPSSGDSDSDSSSTSSDSTTASEFIDANTEPARVETTQRPQVGAKHTRPGAKVSPTAVTVAVNHVIATPASSDMPSRMALISRWSSKYDSLKVLVRQPATPWPTEVLDAVCLQGRRKPGARVLDVGQFTELVQCTRCQFVSALTSESAFKNHRSSPECKVDKPPSTQGSRSVAQTPAVSPNRHSGGPDDVAEGATPAQSPQSAVGLATSPDHEALMHYLRPADARSLWGIDVVSTVCLSGQSVLSCADLLVNSPLSRYISSHELPFEMTLKGEMQAANAATDSTNVSKRLSTLMLSEFSTDTMYIKNCLVGRQLVVSFDGGYSAVLRCYILVVVVYHNGPIVLRPEISANGATLTGEVIMKLFTNVLKHYDLEMKNIAVHVSDECSANKVCIAAVEAYQALVAAASDIVATERLSVSDDAKMCLDRKSVIEAVDTYLNTNRGIMRVYCNFRNLSNAGQAARVASGFEKTKAFELVTKLNQMVFNSGAREERLVAFLDAVKDTTAKSSRETVERLRKLVEEYGNVPGSKDVLVDTINVARDQMVLRRIPDNCSVADMHSSISEIERLIRNADMPSGMVKVGDTRKIRTSRTCYEWTQRHLCYLPQFIASEKTKCQSMIDAQTLLDDEGTILRIHWELEIYLRCFSDLNTLLDEISDYKRHSGPQFYMWLADLLEQLGRRSEALQSSEASMFEGVPPALIGVMQELALDLTKELKNAIQLRIGGDLRDRGINTSFWHFMVSLDPKNLPSSHRPWFPKETVVTKLWGDHALTREWLEYVASGIVVPAGMTVRRFWEQDMVKEKYPRLAARAAVSLDTPVSVSLCDQVLSIEKHLFSQQQRRISSNLWSGMMCHRAKATFGEPNVLERSAK